MINHLTFKYNQRNYSFSPHHPIDISIPICQGKDTVNCYYAEPAIFDVIKMGSFIGDVQEGGPCNHQKITITPHGNGTHTECYGHVSPDNTATIQKCLKKFLFFSELITVHPHVKGQDQIILWEDIKNKITCQNTEALIIRTLPNTSSKMKKQYSGTNPPYLESVIGKYIAELNIKHLLIDLPSVDKEIDGGLLQVHKGFWDFPYNIRKDCTITELIYVDNQIQDGLYLLNLQVMSIHTDASPSKPVIYQLAKGVSFMENP